MHATDTSHAIPPAVLAVFGRRLFRFACHKRRTQHLLRRGDYRLLSDVLLRSDSSAVGADSPGLQGPSSHSDQS